MSLGSLFYNAVQSIGLMDKSETYGDYRIRKAEEKEQKEAVKKAWIENLNAMYQENKSDFDVLQMAATQTLNENYDGYLDGYRKAANIIRNECFDAIHNLRNKGINISFTATRMDPVRNKLIVVASEADTDAVVYPVEYFKKHKDTVHQWYGQGPL